MREIDNVKFFNAVDVCETTFHNKIKLEENTGYGVLWNKQQNIEYFSNLAKSLGFEILESNEEKITFFLRLRKS
ncbi:hypothetical protein LCGC14_0805990 [marine sediment metagenome]|uniref:Uncharacterized protein n=1 Tax=marine sediment metagenome TaxID=412755 RepID=A0A0F9PSN9_9ZZZZ